MGSAPMPVPVTKMTKTQLAVVIENYKTGARNVKAPELGLGYAALKSTHEAAARKRRTLGPR